MYGRILGLCLCFMFMINLNVNAAGITNYSKFIKEDYWIEHNTQGNEIVLDDIQRELYNKEIIEESEDMYDLSQYPPVISGRELKEYLSDTSLLEDPLFRLGKEVSENYKNILRTQMNTELIKENVYVQYGVTVRHTDLRYLPTGEGLFYYPNDRNFDALQQTAVAPCEPLVILHQSMNGYFYYVQSYNYRGWVSKFDIALAERENWLQYVKPQKFLTVVGKNYDVKLQAENVFCDQGTRILLEGKTDDNKFIVKMPARMSDGKLKEVRLYLPVSDAKLNEGYLPYTTNNVLKSVFKHYGAPYGWGDLYKGIDCSSLLANAYRTVGVFLPRNTDEQEAAVAKRYELENLTDVEKLAIIRRLPPGACLYMENHCFMYLGKSNDVPFVIHALATHYTGGKRNPEMRVLLSDLSLLRANGNSFLQELTHAVIFRK